MKIDISSTAIEKMYDGAKAFLGKLIGPAVDEIGLLMKDQVAYFRFKNQIKILNKAEHYCIKHNIAPKTISLKLLCPLIENASLEDDEYLQDKWAVLLSNLVDSEQNIDNHVFPYLLSQISATEFAAVEKFVWDFLPFKESLKKRMDDYLAESEFEYNSLQDRMQVLNALTVKYSNASRYKVKLDVVRKESETINDQLLYMGWCRKRFIEDYNAKPVADLSLKEFEISNLVRLGVLREVSLVQLEYPGPARPIIPGTGGMGRQPEGSVIKAVSSIQIQLTELGMMLIFACNEKTSK